MADQMIATKDPNAAYSWGTAANLDFLPGGQGLNIAHEALDRHVRVSSSGSDQSAVALRWLGKKGERRDFTYNELSGLTNRFANVLTDLGVQKGDRVFTLLGRVPDLYVSILGSLKHGAVVCPMFSAFGPDPIFQRLSRGNARVLVTTEAHYRAKVEPQRDALPELEYVLLIGGAADVPETFDLHALLGGVRDNYTIGPTDPQDLGLLHFTSGTTGLPKGALHVHEAVVAHAATGRLALDLHANDVYWCTADPGWVTGTSYGIIAPLVIGATSIVDEAEFNAERWYKTLQDEQVNVWYTAPTAIRMLMKAGDELPAGFDLSALRFVGSVGEPLNPEAVLWGQRVLGFAFHDNWWQTETGGIMIANLASLEIRPGSMGKPLPGVEAAVLRCDDDHQVFLENGHVEAILDPQTEGMLALRPGWPSMFRGYLHDEERYQHCFLDGWYLSGDLVRRDVDGYFWFVGRADDVIKSSGHVIGPFEVESALMEHPAVAEAGVFGTPDPVAGALVQARVSLRSGYEPTDDLRLELLGFARKRLGPAVAPRSIEFDQQLPKTKSGKIMRRLLRARALGQPEGDTSTMEGPS
jgi:acetyl-CoA synthetase